MNFGLPKCGILIVKSEGISMIDGKMMKNIEEGRYKYYAILEPDDAKYEEIKDHIKKEYIRGIRNILTSKLNGGNNILTISSGAVSIVRYGAGTITSTKMGLKN